MFSGDKMRSIRKLKRISQKKLEILTGIPQTTISDIEQNKIIPNISRFFKLAKALGVSLTDLIDETKI